MRKKESGITLVALMIVLIIMAILIGVTVSMIKDDDNILDRSVEETKNAELVGIEKHIEQTIIKVEQTMANPDIDDIIERLVKEGIIEDSQNDVDRTTGTITVYIEGEAHTIEGKLDDYK